MRIAFWVAVSLIVVLAIVGCGSSSKNNDPLSISLLSDPTLDGQVTATAAVTNQTVAGQTVAKIGDDASNQGMRAVVSFDLSSVPADAIVDSAMLMVYQANEVEGASPTTVTGHPYDPYNVSTPSSGGLGAVKVDHIYYGDTLTSAAYNMVPLSSGVTGSLATTWALGYKQIDVTAAVVDDLANRATRSRSQFRIEHYDPNQDPPVLIETSNNGAEDSDAWVMGEGQGTTLNHKPGLVILYHLPSTL